MGLLSQGLHRSRTSAIGKFSQVLSLMQYLRYRMTSSGQDCYWSLSDLVFLSSVLILHYEGNSVDSSVHVSYFSMFIVTKG